MIERQSSTRLVGRHALLIAVALLVWANAAYGQSGGGTQRVAVPCMVNYLRLRIATGDDDLRGGNDNLNVTVRFGASGFQGAANVNKGTSWDNNSVHLVEIKLNQAVPLNEIKSITLDHLTNGGLTLSPETVLSPIGVIAGLKTADNWRMLSLEVTAVGNGVGVLIVRHGPKYFTESDPVLNIRANLPANSCGIERSERLNPGVSRVQPASGGGSKFSTFQPAPNNVSQQWQNNKVMQQALAHSVPIGPKAGASDGFGDSSNSALVALLRQQSAAARALLVLGPSSSTQSRMLLNPGAKKASNPQLLAPKSSTPPIGSGRTMSASGAQSGPSGSWETASSAQNGHTQQPSSPLPQMNGRAPMPGQMCMAGIASLDGQKSGVWFSPVAGEDGRFVIKGCGFGNTPSEVYLSGVHYAPAPQTSAARAGVIGSPLSRDRVIFQVAPNSWGDRQIVVQIDPNGSGFYDTHNVTLVVKTAGGQQYQAGGMNFLAAREDQTLQLLPKPPACAQSTGYSCVPLGVSLAAVNSIVSGPVQPEVESPSLALLEPGETIAVARETAVDQFPIPANPGHSFPGGTDTYQFHFAPGFQLDPHTGVQLRHATPAASYCQTVGGVPSESGSWSVIYTSTSSFQVVWETDDCWPTSTMTDGKSLDILNYASVSAYELEITVLGPRGVSPWSSGNQNSLTTRKQIQPVQLLQKH